MRSSTVTLINARGLHARAASKFVDVAKTFASEITLTHATKSVDGKSIMALLMLGAPVGTILELNVEGPDQDDAYDAIVTLIEAGFYELDDE